ncbi:hypothetical protein KW801_01475, partial [Candidatus Saccharibacteria bacterium]|nr:hypothetical protein [Candidatus Saccharibacteria bacterium]
MAKNPKPKKEKKMDPSNSSKSVAAWSPFKRTSFSRNQLIAFALVFAVIGGYILYRTFASAPLVATLEAEQMILPVSGSVVTDTSASSGKAVFISTNGTATGSLNLPSNVTSLTVVAKGVQCSGAPTMTMAIDGSNTMTNMAVSSTAWASYSASVNLNAGTHSVALSFTNDYNKTRGNSRNSCTRDLYIDVSNFFGPSAVTPAPTVSLSASPTNVSAGGSSTLTWASTDANTCMASGAWSGSQPTTGSTSTGAINQNSVYTLTCTGPGGSGSASATVTVNGTLAIIPASLATATVGPAYTQSFSTTGGSNPPYSLRVTQGTLPNGLSFTGSTLAGTPTTAGTYAFTFP